jgi:hypothetical protein
MRVRLRAEVLSDLAAMEPHVERIRRFLASASPADQDTLAAIAVALHHGYVALQSAMERVARAFEGMGPAGSTWHRDLLHQMMLPMDTIRPAVLSPSLREALTELLSFCHVFRHAYAATLRETRLRELSELFLEAMPEAASALRAFADALI